METVLNMESNVFILKKHIKSLVRDNPVKVPVTYSLCSVIWEEEKEDFKGYR